MRVLISAAYMRAAVGLPELLRPTGSGCDTPQRYMAQGVSVHAPAIRYQPLWPSCVCLPTPAAVGQHKDTYMACDVSFYAPARQYAARASKGLSSAELFQGPGGVLPSRGMERDAARHVPVWCLTAAGIGRLPKARQAHYSHAVGALSFETGTLVQPTFSV